MTTADSVAAASVFPPLTPHHDRREDGSELVSYATLRRVVGLLGVALPIVVAIVGFVVMGWWRFEPTISDYYAIDSARNAFVGILFTIAWFLFTYRGFDWRDRTTGVFACVFALGVALVPCTIPAVAKYHYLAAGGLFVTLTIFALLFRQSRGWMTREKQKRNAIYLTCAIVMSVCIATIGLFKDLARRYALDRRYRRSMRSRRSPCGRSASRGSSRGKLYSRTRWLPLPERALSVTSRGE